MNDIYGELLQNQKDQAEPSFKPVFELLFLFYLLLGQFIILGVWRLVAPKSATASPLGRIAFAVYLLVAQAGLLFAWRPLMNAYLSADRVFLADVVVTLHLAFVVAVLLACFLVLIGWAAGWSWTRNFWFRIAQLVAIEIVAGQAIVGLECPLTTLERHLRGGPGYLHDLENASAIARFCNDTLFYEGSMQFFAVIYGIVAVLVLLTWIIAPPRVPWEASADHSATSR